MKAREVAEVLQVDESEIPNLGIPHIRLSETELRWEGADVGSWIEGKKAQHTPLLALETEPPTAVLDRENFAHLLRVPIRTAHHLLAPDTGSLWSLPRVVDWVGSLKETMRAS